MVNEYIIQSGKVPPIGGTLMGGKMSYEQCRTTCDGTPGCSAFYRSSDSAPDGSRFYTAPRDAVYRRQTNAQGIEEQVLDRSAVTEVDNRGKCWYFDIVGLDKTSFPDESNAITYIKAGSSNIESLQKDPSSGKMRIVSTNEDLFTQLQKLEKMRDKLIYKEAQLSSQRDVNSETSRIQSVENDKILSNINREIALTKRKLEYKYQEELYYNSKVFLLGNTLFYIFIALIVFCIYLFINEKMGSMEYIKNALQNIKDQFLEFIYKFKSNMGSQK
jgi:hypothetical protein